MTPASGARHTLGFARPSSNLLLPHFVALRRCFHSSLLLFVSFQAFVTDPGEGLGFTSPWKEPLEAAQGSERSTAGQGSPPGSLQLPCSRELAAWAEQGLQRCPVPAAVPGETRASPQCP